MHRLLKLYHGLPAPARVVAANARGLYLRWWRYGRETPSLVSQARQRESWDPDRWGAWQKAEMANLLAHAARQVPHYREVWERRPTGDVGTLEAWPVLSKETLRTRPRTFLKDGSDPAQMSREQTSGTTGKPVVVWWSRRTAREWYALFEARVRMWNGVNRHDRWGMLGGQLVVPVRRTRPPFWVWNQSLNQLYLSSYHLAPQNVGDYLDAMRRYKVTYLFGYASSLYSVAQLAAELRLDAPPMRVAISNAEPLLGHQRAKIAEVFGCPVRDTYGMSEVVCGGSECSEGKMHLWPEVGVIEILRDDVDEPAAPGEPGRIVATGLLNREMPLIRYQTGDRGALEPEAMPCRCGRGLPVLRSIEGRFDDVIVTPDGRRVGRLDTVFKGGFAIREAQIVQDDLEHVRVQVVPAEGFGERDAIGVAQALQDRLGTDVKIRVECVESIPRTKAGKFRAVLSMVSDAAKDPERRSR